MNEATISNMTNPDDLPKPNYFTTRLTEAQLAYEREKAAAKAIARVEKKTLERDERAILKFLRKLSPEEVAEAFELPIDQVNRIATK